MDELKKLIMEMKPLPQLYVGERSLAYMFHFFNGYVLGMEKIDLNFGEWLFFGFRCYLQSKYMDRRNFNWLHLIRAHCPQGVDEIDFLYSNLDGFFILNKSND